jgi:hypothetical protein
MTLVSFLWNVLCGFIASLIFIFTLLIFFRPVIRISPFLCKNQSEFGGEGTMYFVKVVNISLFTAYDIRVEMNVLERYPTPPSGMVNKRMLPLNLVFDSHSNLPGYRPRWMRKEADHCLRFRTKEDLDTIVKNNQKSVEVQLIARHGLTGLVKVYTQEYSDINQIKDGKFSYGTKFGTI